MLYIKSYLESHQGKGRGETLFVFHGGSIALKCVLFVNSKDMNSNNQ